jgi:hypothetical protein
MSDDSRNPFEKFIVDENAPLDRELVSEIVVSFLESIGKNKVIKYTDKFDSAPFWIKVSVYLCIRKIMVDSEIITDEKAGPKEISEGTGINSETAKDVSRDKTLKKILSKENRRYYVRNGDLKKLKSLIEKSGNGY